MFIIYFERMKRLKVVGLLQHIRLSPMVKNLLNLLLSLYLILSLHSFIWYYYYFFYIILCHCVTLIVSRYTSTLPPDRLGVFFMKTDDNGKPMGTWTFVEGAIFSNNNVVFSTDHFSQYSMKERVHSYWFINIITVVFEFADVARRKSAEITRCYDIKKAIHPGLSYH